jgi:hypothetical protein
MRRPEQGVTPLEVARRLLARYGGDRRSEAGAGDHDVEKQIENEIEKQNEKESEQDDEIPIDYVRTLRFLAWYDGVLRAHRLAARTLAEDNLAGATDGDALLGALAAAHRVLLEHPVAARAAWRALRVEGQRFATTDEGAALAGRLRASPRVRRLALLFRSLTMGMLTDGEGGELPSTYLDNLLRAADRADLEQLLGGLLARLGETT